MCKKYLGICGELVFLKKMSRPPPKETNVQLFPALLGIVGVWLLFNQNQQKLGRQGERKELSDNEKSLQKETKLPPVQPGTEQEKPAPVQAASEKSDQMLAPDINIDPGIQARPEEKKQ